MAVRYVGWAFDLGRRLAQHSRRAKAERNHKACWLKHLADLGLGPILTELESGTAGWADAERRWIAHFHSLGANLTNLTDGGEGIEGFRFSEVSKSKMARAKLGKKRTAEHTAKIVASLRGRKRPASVGQAVSRAKLGHSVSEETRVKLSRAIRGRKHTPEAIAKIAAASAGRHHSSNAKAKQRAAKIGKPLSIEHRRKLSEAKRGRPLSEAHKAKIRASNPAGWKHTAEAIAKITVARRARAAVCKRQK